MNRREFIATIGGASLAVAGKIRADESLKRPNILVILSDQHRADCIGAYGSREVRTPHIDALAGDGVRHDRCYCPYPVCTPSRYSMLSGLYVHEHGGWSNQCTLDPGIETYPKILRKAGYRTACVGKMHHTPTYLDVGFERMILSEQDGEGRWDDDYHRELMDHGLVDLNDLEDQRREFRAQARKEYWDTCGALPSNLPLEFHATEWTGRKALEVIDGWGVSGNLLLASFIKPHHPFDPPAEYAKRYDAAKLTIPPGWTPQCYPHDLALNRGYFPHEKLSEEQLRGIIAHYYANIEHIDAQVGRMIDALRRKGLYDNTLIVYTSDHGEYLGHHHMLLKGNHMYEPLARVPFIVKYLGNARAGTVARGLTNLIDLAPTILHQAGCAPASRMGGLDLAQGEPAREATFSESGGGRQVMIRTREHKLILSSEPAQELFYDLAADPLEQTNAIGDAKYAAIVAELRGKLEAWRKPERLPAPRIDMNAPVAKQPNVPRDAAQRERVAAYYREKAGLKIVGSEGSEVPGS